MNDRIPTPVLQADASLQLPRMNDLRADDLMARFRQAMQAQRDEVAAIAASAEPPTVANTAAALDAAGTPVEELESVLYTMTASVGSPEWQAAEREAAPELAAHVSAIEQDPAVHRRLAQLAADPAAVADDESRMLVQRLLLDASRAGAGLGSAERDELKDIAVRSAELTTRFSQNVLHDESTWSLPLPDETAMAGLPQAMRAAARAAADERGLPHPVVTLSRSSIVGFLAHSTRRDLREAAWRAWTGRGEHAGAHDNRPLIPQILALRQRKARLLGASTYADWRLADMMAGTPAKVWALIDDVWPRAQQAFAREEAQLRAAMAQAGQPDAPLEAWDWRWWAERVRQSDYALDDAEVKPYFPLPAMVQAAFECAERLYGLQFTRIENEPTWHPGVDAYEVRAAGQELVGKFLHDNFARPGKRSGAWMHSIKAQHRNGAEQKPIICNNNNFVRGGEGQPALLSPDDVRTLFHEFGHGLHGLLSDVRYRRLSGPNVLRDFVELPSQFMEHWGEAPEVLRRHARHWQTGEAIPDALLARIQAARTFGMGYETLRYTASAILDLALHEQATPPQDAVAFERDLMARRGLPAAAGMNHRAPHFPHIFSSDGYAAGYYVYLWAEVLEADAFDAFTEAGNVFDPALAQRMRREILSRGGSVEPGAAFRAFRGRDPKVEPMLRGRGLIA